MLLKTPSKDSNDEQSASDLRELSFLQQLRPARRRHRPAPSQRPTFLPETGQSTLEKLAHAQKVDETFLDVLGKLIKQNRPVSSNRFKSREPIY